MVGSPRAGLAGHDAGDGLVPGVEAPRAVAVARALAALRDPFVGERLLKVGVRSHKVVKGR
jgi:hypothetical protein